MGRRQGQKDHFVGGDYSAEEGEYISFANCRLPLICGRLSITEKRSFLATPSIFDIWRCSLNKKENWLRLIHNDHPGWIGAPWEAFHGNFFDNIFIADPISTAVRGKAVFDMPYKDAWGTTFLWQAGSVATTPYITAENKALKDVTKWEEIVTFPALDGYDWSSAKEFADSVDRSEYLIMPFITGGLFERSHYLMGFEDALCNYMEEQKAIFELIGAVADWKIGHLERVFRYLHPDVIHFHDDWGTKTNLFLPPDVWRKIIKPHHKRIVDFVKSNGALFMHHSDSFCEPIVEDMAEMGIDIWQGAIPQNDITAIQKRLNGRMAIIGGINAAVIDIPEANEEIIRKEVRRCIDAYCPQGYFIPCIPNIVPLFRDVKKIYEDELICYGMKFYNVNFSFPQ